MSKKSKLLKICTRTATYLTLIATLISLTEPLFAGWIRDGDDANPAQPRRLIQVVFGVSNHGVDPHPAGDIEFVQVKLGDVNAIREYMTNINPPIDVGTHFQFWVAVDQLHDKLIPYGIAAARQNTYQSAINRINSLLEQQNLDLNQLEPIVPANITWQLQYIP